MGGVKPGTSEPGPGGENGPGATPTLELQRSSSSTLPGANGPVPRSRTHTLRGVTKPLVEPLPNIDDAPSGARLKPTLPGMQTQSVEALTSTAVQGGWGASATDEHPAETARWSERSERSYAEQTARQVLTETMREYAPRERSSTLRMSLVRPPLELPRTEPVRRTPTSHRSMATTAATVMSILALAFAARLPVRGHSGARGVLHSSVPGEPLLAPVAGIVREIPVRAGARFKAGQALVIIDPVDARAQLAEQRQRISQLEQRQQALQERQPAQQRALDALRAQASTLRKRYDSDAQRMARLREQRRSYERLVQHGFAAPGGLDDLSILMQGVWRDILAGEQEIANNKQQLLAIEQERTRETQALQTELKEALLARRNLEAALEHSTLLASAAGRLDRPQLIVGQRVESGQVLARALPLGARMRATLEVLAPERARLRVGSAATLTLDEPGMDAWSVDGRISTLRMISELKPGADGALTPTTTLQVEVDLNVQVDDPEALQQLASGTHVSAALSTVPRPLVSVALDEWSSFIETL